MGAIPKDVPSVLSNEEGAMSDEKTLQKTGSQEALLARIQRFSTGTIVKTPEKGKPTIMQGNGANTGISTTPKTGLLAQIKDFSDPSRQTKASDANTLLQIAFLFDTTGSMYPFFKQGKKGIAEISRKVSEKHPHTQFSYVAYKNHGDEEKFFDGTHAFFATPFTNNPREIEIAMEKIRNGGGGDGLTALECVLHFLTHQASWDLSATKAVVLIGDMPPHGVLDKIGDCPHEVDYRAEVASLKSKGIKIYSVFCCEEEDLHSSRKKRVKEFFKWIAKETDGKYLELAEINELVDLMTGICMKETGHLEEFIQELKIRRPQLPQSTARALLALK